MGLKLNSLNLTRTKTISRQVRACRAGPSGFVGRVLKGPASKASAQCHERQTWGAYMFLARVPGGFRGSFTAFKLVECWLQTVKRGEQGGRLPTCRQAAMWAEGLRQLKSQPAPCQHGWTQIKLHGQLLLEIL